MSFHVGQKVVCVDAGPSKLGQGVSPLVRGAIYTIADIADSELPDDLALFFFEIVNEGPDWLGYDPERFRPLVERKTDISIFTAMLKPSKVDA